MAFIRKIKKNNSVYLAEVENYRENGKVKQRVIRYIGKEIEGRAVKRITSDSIQINSVKEYLDYKVLDDIADRLQIKELLGKSSKHILMLVYIQLIKRKPIYQLPEYIEHTTLKEILGLEKLVDKDFYKALDNFDELDFSEIEDKIFKTLSSISSIEANKKALVLDVTDTYFNGIDADWKLRKGKDGKYSKLIQIALAVTKEDGFPIFHKIYEGNISNVKIFKDVIADIRLKEFDVVLLDRGMLSYESIKDLKHLNQKVIAGIKKNENIKRDFLSKINREEIYHPSCCVKLKNTRVFVKPFDFEQGQLIIIYNPELEITKREHAMQDLKNYDIEKAKYMGYSLIYHTTDMDVEEVVKRYFERDIVEKAYKELKSNINLHPIRKYRMNHIKSHIKICYIAYAILSYMQYRLKPKSISAVKALEQLQAVYKIYLESIKDNFKWDKIVTLTNEQKKILELLECSV